MKNKEFELAKDLQNWLLHSDIRITAGEDCGGFFGWKNLDALDEAGKYPYIYNEITGYSLSCFSYLYTETNDVEYLEAMKQTVEYIQKNMINNLLNTGKRKNENFTEKGMIENQIYSFDNGMVLAGLLNYYKVTKDQVVLKMAEKLANALIKYFFKNDQLCYALLDVNLSPLNYGSEKWSTQIGSYHAKLGIGLIDLYRITGNETYLKICGSLCELATSMQNDEGSFLNNLDKNDQIYLHPHLYACEGLTYVGFIKNDRKLLINGLKGIEWAISNMTIMGGVPRSNVDLNDQADCTSQLLRLLILYGKELEVYLKLPRDKIEKAMDSLLVRVMSFFINSEKAIKYNEQSNFACTWCSMFSLQALDLWNKRNNNKDVRHSKIEFFI
ncbi:Glycosyl hydrolase family 76 [Candidatus Nitrosocosmicus oleophilus]|uniref:Glycosyl hydrolase family 76 n=1 Tax=Candidatus Nitrosocosmicus oleophilus TaxID=1353260 RepID=A0A654MDL0_9ARCH|nr:beta-L-arabinofuranosidase domain-containing protein [Candidatus Nitrosocosmicus oleophilus]ALI37562.1 Glycosyl hydrolase family 76 [Candidatus Nitrosocosmicus oleophilus]